MMTNGTTYTLQSVAAALVLGSGLMAGVAPAQSEELSWRQSSVRTEGQGLSYVRRLSLIHIFGAALLFHSE